MLSTGPTIEKVAGRLVCRTGFLGSAMTLGAFRTTASFDPSDRQVRITRRRLWMAKRRRVSFDMVMNVTYGYEDLSPQRLFSWAHDTMDAFSVGLRLFDGEQIDLFTFHGPGAFTNNGPLPDWMYWEDFTFDLVGSQESKSRALVETLSRLIGVPVAPPG